MKSRHEGAIAPFGGAWRDALASGEFCRLHLRRIGLLADLADASRRRLDVLRRIANRPMCIAVLRPAPSPARIE